MRLKGFIGPSYTDPARAVDAQECINLYMEQVESGSREAILRRVPGRRMVAYGLEYNSRGCFAQDGRAWFVMGSILYELYDGGAFALPSAMTALGTVANDGARVAFASNGAGGNQLFIVSGGYGYILDLSTGAFSQIASAFPTYARGAEFLNGIFYTTSGVKVYGSAEEDGLTWDASSYFQRSSASDNLVDIILDDHKVLWAIGSRTTEPLYDAGLEPFSLTPVENSFMGYGTTSPDTPIRFDSSVFFLASSENGERFAVIISGGQSAKRVSTHAIEHVWRTYTSVNDAYTWTYSEAGHVFVVLTFPSEPGPSWVYDAATGAWHRMGRWEIPTAVDYTPDRIACHCMAFGKHLVGGRTTGCVYEQSLRLTDDDSAPIRWVRRTPHMETPDRRWVTCSAFELLANTGDGLPSSLTGTRTTGTETLVNLRYSDDGGFGWSSYRSRGLGATGQYGVRARWRGLGRFADRVWEVSGSDPIVITLIDALVDV